MGCPHCSAEVGASDSYCYSCGAKLEPPSPPSAAAPSESLAVAPRRGGMKMAIVILINLVLLSASAWMAYGLLLRYRPAAGPSVHLGNPRRVDTDSAVAHAPAHTDASPAPAVNPTKGTAPKPARPRVVAAAGRADTMVASTPDAGSGPSASVADVSVAASAPDVGSRGGSARGTARGSATSAEQTAGELNADSVRMVVRHYLPQVRACYDRALKQQEGLSGVVEIKFEVSAEGRVRSSKVNSNSTGHDGLGRCIASVLRGWRFPRPVGGAAVFIYPFVFSSGG
jgi:TonB family protein